jgi:CheY-like chemotaxis protein
MQTTSRIMIVEDEIIVALSLQQFLRDLGYDVTHICISGEEALQKFHKVQPDLVILDIELAGRMNGLETAQAMQYYGDIPFIYLTGYKNWQVTHRSQLCSGYRLISKPYHEEELAQAIESILWDKMAA